MNGLDHDPGLWKLADFTLVANNSGTSAIYHVDNTMFDWTGTATPNQVWNDGTFNCPCAVPYTIISCNSSGSEKNEFAPNETVYVKGIGLSAYTNYMLWIQGDPVGEGNTLNTSKDPSPSQEIVTTDVDGDFGLTAIWSIPSDAIPTHHHYDIVADKQDDGANTGKYNAASDGIDSAIMVGFVAPVPAAAQPPASFLIDGWVSDSSGDPVNDPAVVITNTNTGEVFTVETDASSNYYHAITCSDNVSAGDVLSFSVNGGTATNHAITQDEMDAGGFEENLMVESPVEPDFIEIGDGTETEYYVPFNGNYDYGWSKIIYTKSEIGAPITITKIAFNVSKPAGYSYAVNDQSIYIGHTTDASFDGDVSKPDPSTLTEVYNGSITWESGWTIITLDTSFSYNNVDNLLIYYENRDGSYESDQPRWYRTLTLPDYRSVYNNADGSFPTDDGSQVRFIPNIQLYYSGVATGIAVSKTVYDPDAGEWVNSISGAIPGETYRFRIDVTATGCDLTDVVVNDTLSPGLGYAGNPSPSDPAVIGNVYQWTFETLNESETRTIEFDATVDYRGDDCNLASAIGWCNEPVPEQYSDEATACIDSRVDLAVKSDWNEHIKINPACHSLDYYRIIVNESNTIRVWIINNGPGNITSGEEFDVCFDLNGVEIACVTLQGPLNASEDRYYDIEWTPDCTPRPEWNGYPPMPGYPSTELSGYTLNVTVDCPDCPSCPPGGAINETDEDNNRGYRAVYISNNGYKSKNIDCDPSDPLTSIESTDMYGGVAYNVSGRKNYPFDPSETDTRIHHIEIPAGMTVVEARLYVYWYDYFSNPAPGCLANLGVNFSGTTFTMSDASYNDQKGFGTWNSPKGTYAYDVTSLVTGSGDYTVIVENIDPANYTTLLGEMLLVVYEDPTQDPDNRIQLWITEGCDLLKSDAGYCVTPDEATATVAFGGSIDLANVDTANLISVVSQGMEDGNNLLFNGNITRTDAWNASSEAGPKSGDVDGSKINVEVVDVTDNLTSSGNTLGFQDTGTMGFQASNAILVVKYGEEVSPRPDLTVTEKYETLDGSEFTVTYTVENNGDSNAGASTTCIYVDGKVTTDSVGALAAGATYEGTVVIDHFDCPCGTDVTVSVCADNEDVVDESDETNNCLNNTFSCPPCLRSDLVITEKSEEWIDQVNKIYSITYTVANNGDAAAGASTTSFTIDGMEVATDPVPGLAEEESHTATIGPFTMSGDDDTINVCADKDNVVDEIDETNNCLENTFAVEGQQSYGGSVYSSKNVILRWNALGEPDDFGAIFFRNAKIAIELEETVPASKNVSIRVRKVAVHPTSFDVMVSSDAVNWVTIGSGTCDSRMWTEYDFSGDFGDVKYIGIRKPGKWWRPRIMALDAVYAED